MTTSHKATPCPLSGGDYSFDMCNHESAATGRFASALHQSDPILFRGVSV